MLHTIEFRPIKDGGKYEIKRKKTYSYCPFSLCKRDKRFCPQFRRMAY
jgi:hypothetical protein